MAKINIDSENLDRLLADSSRPRGESYQPAFEQLALTHIGRPVEEIIVLLKTAAERALLGFTYSELYEQAEAIHTGCRCTLRVVVTRAPATDGSRLPGHPGRAHDPSS